MIVIIVSGYRGPTGPPGMMGPIGLPGGDARYVQNDNHIAVLNNTSVTNAVCIKLINLFIHIAKSGDM